MPEPQLGYFFPVSAGHPGHPLPEPPPSGNHPSLPIQLPPLPPGWVMPPIALPPGTPEWPIVIPQPPDKPEQGLPPVAGHPLPQPPGGIVAPPIELPPQIWPPLDPSDGVGETGKYLVLIHIFGVGNRWLIYDATKPVPPPTNPKLAQNN